ncbi:Hypp3510 [Branchiostoma lanceolatum]|uniref:Hypp3510 protein n=1 Tax=Branchiostoma lanceolatum TaxID=7740 RepID=A0A8K0EUC4_BRALA|nr:Hypp3510 [Branchiostoma lanceolatum]
MPAHGRAKRKRKQDPRSSTSDESFREEGQTTKMAAVSLSSIASQLTALASQTSSSFVNLTESVSNMSEDIKSLRLEVSSVKDSVTFAHEEIKGIKEDAKKESEKLHKRINELEDKLLHNEIYSKRQNLLLWGIPSKTGEDVVQEADDFIVNRLGVGNARNFSFVNVHRMPRMNGNPIIVKFVSMLERDNVLRHAYRLQPKSGIGVSEHLPVAIQKQKQ